MKAIILCGGEEKKIWPYNRHWQKACLPVGGRPNILRIIDQIKAAGIHEITVLTESGEAQLRFLLKGIDGVTIETAANDQTGQALNRAAGDSGDILVYYGDIYVHDKDFNALLSHYGANGNTVLLKSLDEKYRSADYICAQCLQGRIEAFYGHPRGSYANAKVAGVFALNRDVLEYNAVNPLIFMNVCVGGMPGRGFYLEQSLQMALEDGMPFSGLYTQENYVDMDFPWDIMLANTYFCRDAAGGLTENHIAGGAVISEKATVNGFIQLGKGSIIGDGAVIQGNCIIGSGTIIENGAILGANTVIGDNCTIRDYCKISPETVIGSKNRIGFSAEITGVTFDNVSAVHFCQVYGVVGRSTDIAAGCNMGILRFDDLDTSVKAPVKKYAGKFTNGIFIGDYTRTGIGNIFQPGVRVGSNSALGPGLIVNRDIPDNKMVLVEQATTVMDWGPERYGW